MNACTKHTYMYITKAYVTIADKGGMVVEMSNNNDT